MNPRSKIKALVGILPPECDPNGARAFFAFSLALSPKPYPPSQRSWGVQSRVPELYLNQPTTLPVNGIDNR